MSHWLGVVFLVPITQPLTRTNKPTATNMLAPTLALEPTNTPRPTNSLYPTITPMSIKPAAEIALRLIKDGLAKADAKVFEQLAYDQIAYGLYRTEATRYYTRKQFLQEVERRLQSYPECAAYTYVSDTTQLFVFTANWDPPWDIGDVGSSHDLVFELQPSNSDEYRLIGAYPNTAQSEDTGEKPCP